MAQKLPTRTKCHSCQADWAFPKFVSGQLDPWMKKAGLQFLCESCLSDLISAPEKMKVLMAEHHPMAKPLPSS